MPRRSRHGDTTRRILAGVALVVACAAPGTADAFLVVTKSKTSSSDRTKVVAVRDGGHTVLSIEANVRGPLGDVALLAVVPPALDEMKTLNPGSFDPVERVSGPRVAEYWEQDPCEFHEMSSTSDSAVDPSAAVPAPMTATASGQLEPAPAYATEVVTGKTGAEIVASLKGDGYLVPARVEAILDGYLAQGFKVVIARLQHLDAGKLPHDGDAVLLAPLTLHYRSTDFTLPTRLLAAAPGKHEFAAYVLSPGVRFEASNQPNMAVPTNLDVVPGVRVSPAPFYRLLVDRAFEQSPKALLTEYAWRASTCEVCREPLSSLTLSVLGASLLPSAAEGRQSEVLVDAPAVAPRPDGPADARASLKECYGKVLANKRGLGGAVKLDVETGGDGAVRSATPLGTPDEALAKCSLDALKSSKAWKANAKGTVTVTFAPVSRAYFADFVLTALRGRYDDVPEHDLTLVAARAIEGGREMSLDGNAPKRVTAAAAGNDFQARYVVRHPFAGPVTCASPVRGVWGGPPNDAAKAPDPDSNGPDAGARVEAFLKEALPDPASFAIDFGPPLPTPAPQATAPPSSASSTPKSARESTNTTPAGHHEGCGSCGVGLEAGGSPRGTLACLVLLALRRRRRVRERTCRLLTTLR